MAATIKHVCKYLLYNTVTYDIIYESGHLFTATDDSLPKSVAAFIKNASRVETRYDKVFRRDETIYMA